MAERLGFFYVDEEIVARAAAKVGIDPREVADEERRKSRVARVLEAITQGSGEAWALGVSGPPRVGDELRGDDMRALIRETIAQTAERGSMVIVAHAASHAVTRGPETLRVLITASPETRVTRIIGKGRPRSSPCCPCCERFGRGPSRLPEALLRRGRGVADAIRPRGQHGRALSRTGRGPGREGRVKLSESEAFARGRGNVPRGRALRLRACRCP